MLSRNDTIVETIVESVEAEDNRQLQISASSFPCPFPRDTKECGETEEKTCQSRLASSRAQPTTFTNKFKPQLVLENHGSVARDHLASERTFLAYVRTSLAVASTGVALVQLLTLSVDASTRGSSTSLTLEPMSRQMRMYAKPLGATFVVFSIVVLAVGLTRYFSIQNALTLNQFPVARLVIISSSFILGALVVCTFGILVAGSS
ncbi:hypothetical protein DFH05DRAFT_1395297 [Lentinula detonsa]|uniref:DUF202 domain-containing protein n=1 Tax=Lentinula detonsa TaxID=2804962 RepID=A0A9W8TZS1_9AGAR|nr:hypothetical protein DFH05DRAFT_1395297 [Lentinula detonsa]